MVVQDISMRIKSGEVVGLLGPNGAGKTTSFYMMVGLVRFRCGQNFIGWQKFKPHADSHARANGLGVFATRTNPFFANSPLKKIF